MPTPFQLRRDAGNAIPVIKTIATQKEGIDSLIENIALHETKSPPAPMIKEHGCSPKKPTNSYKAKE